MNTLPGRGTAGCVRASILSTTSTLSTKSTLLLPHINLSGNRGGDQGSAVFLKPLDGLLDFGYERINLGGFPVEEVGDGALLGKWWNCHEDICNISLRQNWERGAGSDGAQSSLHPL